MLEMASTRRRATFWQSWFGNQEILSSTGPGILSDAYSEYQEKPGVPQVCKLPAKDFNNQGEQTSKYTLHMSTQSWRAGSTKLGKNSAGKRDHGTGWEHLVYWLAVITIAVAGYRML